MSTMEEHEKDENFLPKMDLPHDLITLQIITRLPIKSVLSFKCVSKHWYSTLSSPHFGNTHFKFSPFYHPLSPIHCVFAQSGNNFSFISCEEKGSSKLLDIDFDGPKDETFLVGSCNGLVCLVSLSGCLIIWNPIIHQCDRFECPFASFEVGNESIAWGFGYVSSLDDYKVVRLGETGQPNEIICHVFSLRTKKWEQIHDPRLSECSFARARRKRLVGVLVNETLHWIVDKQNGGYGQDILGFDLALERFYKMKCLVPSDTYLSGISFLCVIGGYLSMCRFTNRGDVSISILKQYGQVEYIGLYRDLDLSSCSALVGFTRADELFIQLGNQELGLVDLKSSPRKYTRLVKFEGEGKTYVSSYVPSLISPLHISD